MGTGRAYRGWFLTVMALLVCGRLLLALLNYIVDPFDVFQSGLLLPVAPNERFLKTGHLIENPGRYNSFIVGSSRANSISCSSAEKYFEGSRFYNLTVSGGNWLDSRNFVLNITSNGSRIDNLLILVDYDHWGFDNRLFDFQRKMHPLNRKQGNFAFFSEYIRIIPLENIITKIVENIKGTKLDYDLKGCGNYVFTWGEAKIAADHDKYIQSEKSFHVGLNRSPSRIYAENYELEVSMLRQFTSMLKEMGIKPLILISPNNYNKLNEFNVLDYTSFLQKLVDSGITDLWDFNGYNSITMENRNYYESSHFRPHVGHLMLARIFNDTTVDIPQDFGVRVTANNLYIHIDNIIGQFKWADRKFSR